MADPFLALIKKYGGIVITLGFRDDEDHFLGGVGSTVWYYTVKGRAEECYIGELQGDKWTDRHILKKKTVKDEPATPGTAIEMIRERAFFKQAEIASSGRKPVPVQICGNSCSHYVFSFGARAYDISDEFGVTVCYSNIDDEKAGWRLRQISIGSDLRPPQI